MRSQVCLLEDIDQWFYFVLPENLFHHPYRVGFVSVDAVMKRCVQATDA